MADEIPASVSATPSVPEAPIAAVDTAGAAPGPADGTTPPGAGAPEASLPAADLPSTEPAAPTSVLSEAKADAPAEVEVPKPAEPLPLPTYEAFTLPDGVTLRDEPVQALHGLLGEFENRIAQTPAEAHAAAQELGQKLVDMYVADMRDQTSRNARFQAENWTRTREQWVSDFKADKEIGGNRYETTLSQIGGLMERYSQEVGAEAAKAVRDVADLTGFGDHPAVLRLLHWAAGYTTEQSRMVAAPPRPVSVANSKAQRLYRASIGAA